MSMPYVGKSPIQYVLAICLLLRVLLLALVHPWDPAVWTTTILTHDSIEYDGLANTLLGAHRFAQAADALPDGRRTPLYPLYIASVYVMVGSAQWMVLVGQILIDTATCAVLYFSLRRLVCHRVAALAAAFFALDPFMILYSSTLYSDTLFVFCLSLFLYSMVRATEERSLRWWAATGVTLGIATLDRPTSLYLPLVITLFILWHYRSRRRDVAWPVIFFVGGFLLMILPWLARNYVAFQTLSYSASGGYVLLINNALPLEMDRTHQSAEVTTTALMTEVNALLVDQGVNPATANDFVVASAHQQVALSHIRQHAASWVKVLLVGWVHGFLNVGTSTLGDLLGIQTYHLDFRENQRILSLVVSFALYKGVILTLFGLVVAVYLAVTYVLTVFGIATILRSDRRDIWILFALIAAYFVVVAGPAEIARFKMPTVLFYLAFTGIGAAALQDKLGFSRQIRPTANVSG